MCWLQAVAVGAEDPEILEPVITVHMIQLQWKPPIGCAFGPTT